MIASKTILAGLIDGIDESRYGVIITPSQECIRFEIAPDGALSTWEVVEEPDVLASDFHAVSAGVSMLRRTRVKRMRRSAISRRGNRSEALGRYQSDGAWLEWRPGSSHRPCAARDDCQGQAAVLLRETATGATPTRTS